MTSRIPDRFIVVAVVARGFKRASPSPGSAPSHVESSLALLEEVGQLSPAGVLD
jgi:hypothetical protein